MYKKINIVLVLVIGGYVFGCTTASESDLVDAIPIVDVVSYTDQVKNIIDNNCIVCHTAPPINGAPMPLLTYESVKNAVENRNLIGRISSTDQSFLMPFGGPRLPQILIDIIVRWEQEGLLE